MKKDVIIASLVGFVLGSVTAILVINLPNIVNKNLQTPITTDSLTPTPNSISKISPLLSIESPADESIVLTKSVEILGKATEGTLLVLDTELDNNVQVASGSGNFSFPVTLKEGANSYVLTAYNENGEGESKTLTLFYTSEKL